MSGSRVYDTHVYEHGRWPLGFIGPVAVIWQPMSQDFASVATEGTATPQNGRQGKGKQKSVNTDVDPSCLRRVIWVRAHPAVFNEVFEVLKNSTSHALQMSKEKNPDVSSQIEMADLRGSINAFEIMGSKSSQVIKGALSPVGSEDREDFKKVRHFWYEAAFFSCKPIQFWLSLSDLQTAGNIPRRMVIGFKIHDPRLKYVRILAFIILFHYVAAGSLRRMQSLLSPI